MSYNQPWSLVVFDETAMSPPVLLRLDDINQVGEYVAMLERQNVTFTVYSWPVAIVYPTDFIIQE